MTKRIDLTVLCACIMAFNASQAHGQGASLPFVSYEAEDGVIGGGATVVSLTSPPTTEFSSPELEASGHAYAHLGGTGQYVRFTNTTGQTIYTLNIRYSIPDSSGGGGISNTIDLYVGGTFVGQIPVNSYQTWVYETSSNYNGMSQDPSSGNAHVFWDQVAFFVPGGPIPPGTNFTIQMDSQNTAAYYNIDVVDLETPPAPLQQPANSFSILTYGAESNNPSFDNTTALNDAVSAAQPSGGTVWVPPGIYYIGAQSSVHGTGVTIQGAGPWYSEFMYSSTKWTNGIFFHTTSTSFQDLCIDSDVTVSTPALQAILTSGGNYTISNVWARHCMLIWGGGTNMSVVNCRANNSWGDGMNINNIEGLCTNVVVSNNFSRGNGDDAIAINSQETSETPVEYATVANNTTVASWWANQMGIYGGRHLTIENNFLRDSVKKQGLELNGGFGALPPLDQTVENNYILRGGSFGYAEYLPGIMIEGGGTNMTVNDNDVVDAMFSGIEITGSYSLTLDGNYVTGAGTTGVLIASGATGSGTIDNNSVGDIASGQSAYVDDASGTFSASLSGNSWQGSPPSPPASLTPHVDFANEIRIDWSGVSGATSYDLWQSSTSGGPYEVIATGLTGGIYTNTGLPANSTFYYVVAALNSSGESGYSGQVGDTTEYGTPPTAPASLTPDVLSSSAIKVDWSTVTGATSYDLWGSTLNGGPYNVVASGLTSGTYTNTGLAASTTYYYVVTSFNSSGQSSYSRQVSGTTQ